MSTPQTDNPRMQALFRSRFESKRSLEDLSRVQKKLALESHPPVLSIVGTNGKGSCAHLLSKLLTESDYKVGLFTSPHIQSHCERIRIGETPIVSINFDRYFEKVMRAFACCALPPSWFDVLFFVALLYFRDQKVDRIVLEAGMGARLDACNLLNASASAITSVDLDHTEHLGNTKDAIAKEKIAILRRGKAVAVGDASSPPSILRAIHAMNAPSFFAHSHLRFLPAPASGASSLAPAHAHASTPASLHAPWRFVHPKLTLKPIHNPSLHPQNAACALLLYLHHTPTHRIASTHTIHSLVQSFELFGRQSFGMLGNHPCIFDASHNHAGIQSLITMLDHAYDRSQIQLIFAMKARKDLKKILSLLTGFKHIHLYPQSPHTAHLMPAQKLGRMLSSLNIKHTKHPNTASLQKVLSSTPKKQEKTPTFVVCGSFFVLRAVLEWNQSQQSIE